MNLKNIYSKINNCLDRLYDYEDCSGHIDLVNEMSECIDLLSGYFGVRIFKIDIGPFKKDEMIYIMQDEYGAWIESIDWDDDRTIDLFDDSISTIPFKDWFYPIPEPSVDVIPVLTGKKTVDEVVEETVNRVNYLVDKTNKLSIKDEIFDF